VARIAFIGLGTMGLPIARHLVAAGHDVTAHDLDSARVEALDATSSDSVARAAREAEYAFTSLPAPAVVEQVAREIAGTMPAGGVFVDLSTGPPALARQLAADFSAAGLEALDAPVSGGPTGAAAGTLTVMVGGSEGAFTRAEPVLRAFGRPFLVGGSGAGQTAKLCNNLVAGVTMAALAEACAVAQREGIDPALLYELLTTSTGDSRVLRTRYPLTGVDAAHPSSNEFAPLFMLDLIAKDLELAIDLAGVAPVAAAALAGYREAQAAGLGALDYSAVFLDIVGRGQAT
jgi:3-hydroxyisobutyrate dehydrogenase